MHWRTTTQEEEVDFVVEFPSGKLLPIEVKTAAQPGWGDVAGLRSFLDARPLAMPNAWDAASARVIELAGAPAVPFGEANGMFGRSGS